MTSSMTTTMTTPSPTIREEIHFLIVMKGGPNHTTLRNVYEELKKRYGCDFVRSHKKWIRQQTLETAATTGQNMLQDFREMLAEVPNIFDEESHLFRGGYRWVTEYGEILLLTKNIEEELALHAEFLLCLSAKKDKGIAMLRKIDSGDEISYLFFTEPLDFIATHFPVVFEHPQAFDMEMIGDNMLIVPESYK